MILNQKEIKFYIKYWTLHVTCIHANSPDYPGVSQIQYQSLFLPYRSPYILYLRDKIIFFCFSVP